MAIFDTSAPDSHIWRLIWRSHRPALIKVILINLVNAVVGVTTIAFINRYLLSGQALSWQLLPIFLSIILALLATTFAAQWSLTNLGHAFVKQLRGELLKRILDTPSEQVSQIGTAKLLASLSTDIQAITAAFVRLPELIQGVILCVTAGIYLGVLSVPLLLVIIVWIAMTILVSSKLVNHVYKHLAQIRLTNDALYQDYQAIIQGEQELKLHRPRAKYLYQIFVDHSEDYRRDIVKSDTYHLSAVNWSNIMMFAGIGLILVVSQLFNFTSIAVATTFCLTILFIQSPLLHAVGAYPMLQSAQIALAKIQSLKLGDYQPDFAPASQWLRDDWEKIEFDEVSYSYQVAEEGGAMTKKNFGLQPINFSLNRGDVIFLIGSNGSGKTTFAKLLTGIYPAKQGKIWLDDTLIDADNLNNYRQLFSAIFSDFYLFDTVMDAEGQAPDDELVEKWLNILQMTSKTQVVNQKINDIQLSQGQKKRLAMLLAICDDKPIMLLDEWAADQDPTFRRYFYHELIPLLKNMGKTLFIISHDDNYFSAADRLLLMKEGTLVELTGDTRAVASHDAVSLL